MVEVRRCHTPLTQRLQKPRQWALHWVPPGSKCVCRRHYQVLTAPGEGETSAADATGWMWWCALPDMGGEAKHLLAWAQGRITQV